jgi:hypothetical protein
LPIRAPRPWREGGPTRAGVAHRDALPSRAPRASDAGAGATLDTGQNFALERPCGARSIDRAESAALSRLSEFSWITPANS